MEKNKNIINAGLFTTDISLRIKLETVINSWENFGEFFTLSNKKELTKKIQKSSLHILLLDINIHSAENRVLIRDIKNEAPQTKILIFSKTDDPYNIIQSFRAGAHGHIPKNIDNKTLRRALLSVHHTGSYYNEKLLDENPATHKFHDIAVTEGEQKMLALFCSEYTLREITAITGHSRAIVEGYRQVLFEKLKVPSREALIEKAYRLGFMSIQNLAD